ncbi:MAG: methylmalonyl-CoA epimerase [Candidatus Aminicenantes bacterium]|nr:methylmalonyl-CoA epimerase [Candidatus Aminicenantes bacterium]
MIRSIDHLGIAVADLEAATAFFRDVLGLPFEGFEDLPDRHLRAAIFSLAGVRLELLQPTSPEAAIAPFLEKTGGGLHHLALEVDDAAAELARLASAGVALIDREPRPGVGGAKIAFLSPRSSFKVLIELCEKGRPTGPGR